MHEARILPQMPSGRKQFEYVRPSLGVSRRGETFQATNHEPHAGAREHHAAEHERKDDCVPQWPAVVDGGKVEAVHRLAPPAPPAKAGVDEAPPRAPGAVEVDR